MANSSFKIMSALILILSLMVPNIMATEYVVGGNTSGGWDLAANRTARLGLKVLRVGDILHFNLNAPHTVALVSETAYLTCDVTNVLADVTGASFVFPHTGVFAFVSTFPGDCLAGLKLLVTVR